jgi:hypothetical protein
MRSERIIFAGLPVRRPRVCLHLTGQAALATLAVCHYRHVLVGDMTIDAADSVPEESAIAARSIGGYRPRRAGSRSC